MKISRKELFFQIVNSYKSGGSIISCGNGGSATQSNHLAEELVGRYKKDRRPIRALSLTSDAAIITCISNDYGYENIFSRQIECMANKNDILLCFSTSGKSNNIINAIKKAKEIKLANVLITGENYCGNDEFDSQYYAVNQIEGRRIQEEHLVLIHDIIEEIEINILQSD